MYSIVIVTATVYLVTQHPVFWVWEVRGFGVSGIRVGSRSLGRALSIPMKCESVVFFLLWVGGWSLLRVSVCLHIQVCSCAVI